MRLVNASTGKHIMYVQPILVSHTLAPMCMPCACHVHVESCAHAGAQCGVVSFPDPLLSCYYMRTFPYHFFNWRVEGLGTRLSVVQTQWCYCIGLH